MNNYFVKYKIFLLPLIFIWMIFFCSYFAFSDDNQKADLIAIILPVKNDVYFQKEADGAVNMANVLGYRTVVLAHFIHSKILSKLFKEIIEQDVKAIIIDNPGVDILLEFIQMAKNKGIPSFVTYRELSKTGVAVSQILINREQCAKVISKEFVSLMSRKGNYIELIGIRIDLENRLRSKWFHDIIDNYPDMNMLLHKEVYLDPPSVSKSMQKIIKRYPDIHGVICGYGIMSLGVIDAFKAVNKEDVIVVGYGGGDEVIESIKKGDVKATALLPFKRLGELAVIQADKYLKTGSTGLPEKQWIDCDLITPSNVNTYLDERLKN